MIYLVRHGQTDWNKLGIYQGHTDIELNDIGISQAKEIKQKLKDIKFDFIFASPLKRAYKTAQIIHSGDIIIDQRLIERYNGKLEGKHKNEIVVDFTNPKEQKFDIEPLLSFRKRIYDFWDCILKEYRNKNILVVTHSGVGIYTQCYFKGEPQDNDYTRYMIKNCDVLKIETKGIYSIQ